MKPESRERIICAAIHIDDGIERLNGQQCIPGTGFVIAGFSHDEIRRVIRALNLTQIHQNDGFLTSYNRFVSRATAAKIALYARQIKKEVHELISTDLYEN